MTEKIRFATHRQSSTLHNPLLGNRLDRQELEIRKDPLTGRQSIFNPRLQDKAAVFFGPTDAALIERLARASEPGCFLCEERWKQTTPKYPEELVPGGRIQVGEAVLFPNLFPLSQVHAVIRVGSKHYLPLVDFPSPLIEAAFQTFREFLGCVSKPGGTVRYLTLNGNYLGPAGASIFHPHFQVLGGDLAFSHLEELLALSGEYLRAHGTCYWADLAEKEKEIGERFIVQTGAVSWITSFSPQGANEILGIVADKRDFLEMGDQDFSALAQGLSAIFRGYGNMGISTFNFTLYSGPLGTRDEAFRCFLRVISRQNVYENYRTDDYFLQKLLRNELILNPPEALATSLRNAFGAGVHGG
jgi:UDPglucose--hexose-1-phosphate uridylyltransferase